jgi:adenylate kinase
MTTSIDQEPNTLLTPPTKPLAVILLGPPGAGKGTHAGPLSGKLGLPHISTGDLLREHIQGQTELGKLAKGRMDEGTLVPDDLVLTMLFERIERLDCARGYILDGFPRTKPQAEALDAYFGNDVQVTALYFSVPDRLLIERIIGRITCKDCARPYHLHFDPPKQAGTCDDCNKPLFQRTDDQEEVVRKRLAVYHTQTQPVIDHYISKQGVFRQVSAQGNKDDVFQDALRLL